MPNHTTASLAPGSITDANCEAIARSLLTMQARFTSNELAALANEGGYFTDSGYDYLGGALEVTNSLLQLAYEGNANDLVTWLVGLPSNAVGVFGPNLGCYAHDCLCPVLMQVYDRHHAGLLHRGL